MRAVVVTKYGRIADAAVAEFPDPVPGPDDILIRVQAVAANYVDLLVIGGKYQFLPDLPFVPGKASTGIVETVGANVTRFKQGDRVLAMTEQGGYAELVAIRNDHAYRLPDSLSFVDAASMSLCYDTAWFAMFERGRLQPGETALVLGATGGVGYACVQLAKAKGAKVLAGLTTPAKADLFAPEDVDGVIDLSVENLRDGLRDQVYALTGGEGADVIMDPLGDAVFGAALRALAWRGRLVVVGFAAGDIPSVKANYLLLKNIEVSGLQVSDYRKKRLDMMDDCFADIFALYDAGKIKAAPSETFALEDFATALDRIESRQIKGRAILEPNRD
jgi:NADPH2:quinone reductase